jgi:ABC-type nitrate/sulfonate/bicarbonate transport system permease component
MLGAAALPGTLLLCWASYLLLDRSDLVLVAIITLALLGKASDAVLVQIEKFSLRWRDVADPHLRDDREGAKHA